MLYLLLSTTMLVGFILWYYPPGRATDPENGTVLESASDVPHMRIAWAVVRTSFALVALPVLYAVLGRPTARRLWVLWAVIVAGWLFAGGWYPNVD
jgi:hypothetical protein